MSQDNYNDCTRILAEIKFPSETINVEGEIRFGNHPNKGGYKTCLKIDSLVFSDDKFEIKKFDANQIILVMPISYSKTNENSEVIVNYKIDERRELNK